MDSTVFDYYNSNNTPIQWINMENECSQNNKIIPEWYYFRTNQHRSYAYLKEEEEMFINNFITIINNYIIVLNLKNDYSHTIVNEFIDQNYRIHKINFRQLDYIKDKFKIKHSHQ